MTGTSPQSVPTNLTLPEERHLRIDWNDGTSLVYEIRELRRVCPCATCREKRKQPAAPGQLPVLSAEEARPLRITGMSPVGNYAYSIHFSDGHDTGIYTLEFLRELGQPMDAAGK